MILVTGNGNLTKDPEAFTTSSGKTICRMSIACNSNYAVDGEKVTQYFTLIAWNKLGENCLKYLKKGSKLGFVGNPQNRSYEASDGTKRTVFEIVVTECEFLGSPRSEESGKVKQDEMKFEPISDDDLPF